MIFAVTGPSGSGKDLICSYFSKAGWLVIDLDQLGHKALSACVVKLEETFGSRIIDRKGHVDRSILGNIVFSDKNRLRELERIVHPWMKEKVLEILRSEQHPDIIINGSLVISMNLDKMCDFIIYLEAPVVHRFLRVRKRDRKPVMNLVKRFFNQRHLKSQIKNSMVDIYNVLNFGKPEKAVAEINRHINNKKRSSHARNK